MTDHDLRPKDHADTIRRRELVARALDSWGAGGTLRIKVEAELDALVAERQQAIDERDAALRQLQHFKECADTPLMADVLRDKQQAIDALRFYADPTNHSEGLIGTGEVARAALVSLGEKP